MTRRRIRNKSKNKNKKKKSNQRRPKLSEAELAWEDSYYKNSIDRTKRMLIYFCLVGIVMFVAFGYMAFFSDHNNRLDEALFQTWSQYQFGLYAFGSIILVYKIIQLYWRIR